MEHAMARPFDFLPHAAREARIRQWGRCAACGDALEGWEESHHVIPNRAGRMADPDDAFLRSAANCVVLCDSCHAAAHSHGAYSTGAVAPPGWYRYSHGTAGHASHLAWRRRLDDEWQRIYRREARMASAESNLRRDDSAGVPGARTGGG